MNDDVTSVIGMLPLVLGGNTFGWTSSEAESFEILDAFVALGGRLVDTADVYSVWAEGHEGGESEHVIGRWLAGPGAGSGLLVGTKVGRHPSFSGLSAAAVRGAVHASLERLGVERVEILYAHYDDPDVPLEETVQVFHELQLEGRVGRVGLSNYSGARVGEWIAAATRLEVPPPDCLQPHYNLVHRASYERSLAPVVAAADLAVFPYFALASGFLTGKYRTLSEVEASARRAYATPYFSAEGLRVVECLEEVAESHGTSPGTVALAWLRLRPGVLAPIASARTTAQLDGLAQISRVRLGADEVARLDECSARVAAS